MLDYIKLGLTADQQSAIESSSSVAYDNLEAQLCTSRQLYSALQVSIIENQKLISETTKAINALAAMNSSDQNITSIVASLQNSLKSYNTEQIQLFDQANAASQVSYTILTSMRSLAQVVR